MKKERDYNKGKLYFIRSYQTDDVYIGSTIQTLSTRMSEHRSQYKRYLNGKYHYVTSFEILKYPDAYIELIKYFPCKTIDELNKEEGEYIRKNDCVNKCIAGRTQKEYSQEFKEQIKDYHNLWYEQNKETQNEKKREHYKEHREDILQQQKVSYEKRKDKIQEYKKEYAKSNKEKISQYKKEWYKKNRDKILLNQKEKITP